MENGLQLWGVLQSEEYSLLLLPVLQSSQKNVNGDVYVTLHPFRFELNGIKSKNDLMNNVFGTYGEINNKWSAEDAKGFIKIVSNQNKIHQYVNSK